MLHCDALIFNNRYQHVVTRVSGIPTHCIHFFNTVSSLSNRAVSQLAWPQIDLDTHHSILVAYRNSDLLFETLNTTVDLHDVPLLYSPFLFVLDAGLGSPSHTQLSLFPVLP